MHAHVCVCAHARLCVSAHVCEFVCAHVCARVRESLGPLDVVITLHGDWRPGESVT